MPRKSPSLTRQLFGAVRASDDFRAALRGPIPYSKRVVRRKMYGTVNRQAGKSLRSR